MTPESQFAGIMRALCEAFHKSPSDTLLDLYWAALSDIPMERLQEAAVRAVRESRFMPTVAELRSLAGNTAITEEDWAEMGWEALTRAVNRFRSVTFSDVRVNATIRHLGGWGEVCNRYHSEDERARAFLKRDFLRSFATIAKIRLRSELTAPLLSLRWREDRKNPEPTLYFCGPPDLQPLLQLRQQPAASRIPAANPAATVLAKSTRIDQ